MSGNRHAINGAVVNGGSYYTHFADASASAAAGVVGELTYHWMVDKNLSGIGGLESYAWQTHTPEINIPAFGSLDASPYAHKYESSSFSASAQLYGQVFYGGESALFDGVATINTASVEAITYKWLATSNATEKGIATFTGVDDTLYNHAVTNSVSSAIFYPEPMIKLNGETTYTHTGTALPGIYATSEISGHNMLYNVKGWSASCTSSVTGSLNYKWFRSKNLSCNATATGSLFTSFRDTPSINCTASINSTVKKFSRATASNPSSAIINLAFARATYATKASLAATASTTGTGTAKRFGTYPVINGFGYVTGNMVQTHSVSSDMYPQIQINAEPFQWHWHYETWSGSAQADIDADAVIYLPTDAVTFVRSAETKDFLRAAEAKDFIRTPT